MTIKVGDEFVDGYSIESIPIRTYMPFNWDAVSKSSGIRAIWLLYKRSLWDNLEDLGIERSIIQPLLSKYAYGENLTDYQVNKLYKNVPLLVQASKQLRLMYFLKYYDTDPEAKKEIRRKINMETQVFIAQVNGTDKQAETILNRHKAEIEAAGGEIAMLRGFKTIKPHIKIILPGDNLAQPENLLVGEKMLGPFERQRGSLTIAKKMDN